MNEQILKTLSKSIFPIKPVPQWTIKLDELFAIARKLGVEKEKVENEFNLLRHNVLTDEITLIENIKERILQGTFP